MIDSAVLEIFSEARAELVQDDDAVCRHCRRCRCEHASLKCLYVSTSFDAALCTGCGLPHIGGRGDVFRLNPVNDRGYHLECDPVFMKVREQILTAVGLPKEFVCP